MFDLTPIGLPYEGVLVDVGANCGEFFRETSKLMLPTRSLCIEMLGDLAEKLQEFPVYHAPAEGRYVVHCAVGDKPGKARTRRVVFHPSSSLLVCNEEVGRRLGHNMTALYEDEQEEVRVETLDKLCFDYDIIAPDLLKIDVQGYEARVLKGAPNILARTERVVIEIILAHHYDGQSDPQEIRELLAAGGLRFSKELNRDIFPDNGEVLEVDELWVRH
jgi:FkbM family methyltransferase